jgi:hypothetical protein
VSSRIDELDARLKARLPAAPAGASQAIVWPGGAPSLQYGPSTTTTSNFRVPPGTLGIAVISGSGFSSLKLTGRTTQFPYLSVGNVTFSQYLASTWASSPDDEGSLSIVTGPGQSGSLFAVAFLAPIPPSPTQNVRATAFPSQALAIGTYNFDPPAQTSFRGIMAYLIVTAGGGGVTLAIQILDPNLSGSSFGQYLISSLVVSGGAAAIRVYPGIPTVANQSVGDVIGQTIRLQVVTNATMTFAVDYDFLP